MFFIQIFSFNRQSGGDDAGVDVIGSELADLVSSMTVSYTGAACDALEAVNESCSYTKDFDPPLTKVMITFSKFTLLDMNSKQFHINVGRFHKADFG